MNADESTSARELAAAFSFAALVSIAAAYWTQVHAFTLYFGDAESHLNIARRILDSREPGFEQLGIPWLPLPHLLMLPFIMNQHLWTSGLAGTIPNAMCFTAAATMLFAATRRILHSGAAWCALAVFVLNPNMLYLQSLPMTEAVFAVTLMGMLYCSTRGWAAGAGFFCLAATLTRYEGWILIPFATLHFLLTARPHRWWRTIVFGAIASIGPLCWFFYNRWMTADYLYFLHGEGSAEAIQGGRPYPGHGDWHLAIQYFGTACKLVCGWPLVWIGLAGVVVALARRRYWPVLLLALPPMFYVWNLHSSASPIHIPVLPPFSWYNTRYALSILPLLAFATGALVPKTPKLAWLALVLFTAGFWLFHLDHQDWVTWKESEQNSIARRDWTHQAANFITTHAAPDDTFFTVFCDICGIYREAGISFKRTLTWDEWLEWQPAVNRPDLFLFETWAVAQRGDPVDETMKRSRAMHGPVYDLAVEIAVPGATPIEIYRRHEYTVH